MYRYRLFGAFVIASLTAGGVALGAGVAAPARSLCGVDRWTVKTLQDRPHLLRARKTTIHYLVTRPAPGSLPDTRLPFERHVFTVVAAVVLVAWMALMLLVGGWRTATRDA